MKHCCAEMKLHLDGQEVDIHYEARLREFSIGVTNGTDSVQLIKFCPWCGNTLPEGLTNLYCRILRNEYNLDPWDDKTIPPEFKTDEWWKKRGV